MTRSARLRFGSDLPPARLPVAAIACVVTLMLILFVIETASTTLPTESEWNLPAGDGAFIEQKVVPPMTGAYRVRLTANSDGSLERVRLNDADLGAGPAGLEALSAAMLRAIGQSGNPVENEVTVEIDADYSLSYASLIDAVARCSGRTDPVTGKLIRYADHVTFAPPRDFSGAALRSSNGWPSGSPASGGFQPLMPSAPGGPMNSGPMNGGTSPGTGSLNAPAAPGLPVPAPTPPPASGLSPANAPPVSPIPSREFGD